MGETRAMVCASTGVLLRPVAIVQITVQATSRIEQRCVRRSRWEKV